jgi:hypothetical protein
MASELVKLHRGEDIKPRAMNKWNLAQGSLVYTHENRRLMGARFRKAIDLQIYDNSFGTPDTTEFLMAWGKYEGKTERFSSLNLLHQRGALLGSFGETGNKGIDTVWNVANGIANWPDTVAGVIVNANTKFFVGFFSSTKREPYLVMHNQKSIAAVQIDGKTSLAKLFHKYRTMFI